MCVADGVNRPARRRDRRCHVCCFASGPGTPLRAVRTNMENIESEYNIHIAVA